MKNQISATKINESRFDHWLFKAYAIDARKLAALRITYVLFVVFVFGLPDFGWIAKFPQAFYDPRLFSIAIFFKDFPPALFLNAISALCAIGFAMLFFGWRTRLVSFLLPLLIFTAKSFAYSFGKIDHDILLWILPWLMAPAGWGEAWSLDSLRRPAREVKAWPVTFMVFIVGFGMLTAAIPKALGGWLDFSTQAVKSHLAYNYYVVGRQQLLSHWFLGIQSRAFWEFMDWSAILFEFGFFLSVVKKSWLRIFVLIALVFHVVNLLMLNISFKANLMSYMLVFNWAFVLYVVDRYKLGSKFKNYLRPAYMWVTAALFLLIVFGLHGSVLYAIPGLLKLNPIGLDLVILSSALLLASIEAIWTCRQHKPWTQKIR